MILGILVSGLQLLESNEKRAAQQFFEHPTNWGFQRNHWKINESYLIYTLTSGDSLDFIFTIWVRDGQILKYFISDKVLLLL